MICRLDFEQARFYYPSGFLWTEVDQKGLRGSAPTRIDEKGRLKIPTLFRGLIQGWLRRASLAGHVTLIILVVLIVSGILGQLLSPLVMGSVRGIYSLFGLA